MQYYFVGQQCFVRFLPNIALHCFVLFLLFEAVRNSVQIYAFFSKCRQFFLKKRRK